MDKYTTFAYLWPPRPEKPVPVNFLNFYRKRGWVAQYKKNGTCSDIFVSPTKDVTAMTRHNDEHKQWSPSKKSSAPFKGLSGGGWYVFVGEVLNNKVPGYKDIIYVFDILVADGNYLVGMTYEDRQELLKTLFLTGDEAEEYSHYVISDNVWLAKNFTEKFKKMWTECDEAANTSDGAPLDEGLVLKDPKSTLNLCTKQKSNSGWQVKCRISHKNYGF